MTRLWLTFGLLMGLSVCGCGSKEPPAATTDGAAAPAASGNAGDISLGDASAAPAETPAPAETASTPASASAPAATNAPVASAPTTSDAAAATVVSGVELDLIHESSGAAIIVRPSQAFQNPLVQGMLKEIEAASPDFKLSERMDEMRAKLGVEVQDIDHVLVVFDQQHMQMLPGFLMLFMLGDAGAMATPDTSLAAIETVQTEVDGCDDAARPPLFAPDDNPPANPGAGGPPGAPFGFEPPPAPLVVVKFTRPMDGAKLLSIDGPEPVEKTHGSHKYYAKGDVFVWFRDPTTAISAAEPALLKLMDGQKGTPGPLSQSVAPLAGRELAIIADIRPLHGFISQFTRDNPNPVAAIAGGLIKQVNTLTLDLDLAGNSLLQLQLHTISEGSATGLQDMLRPFLDNGKQMFAKEKAAASADLNPHQQALVPLVSELVEGSNVTAEGTVCRVAVPRPKDLDQLPTLLRPVLAEAAASAAAAKELNNLRIIAIAFHNHHDARRRFPSAGGPGDPSSPGQGLSWRVHLLPYLDEMALYEEFHLDEPWDSDHNKTLIARMPQVYGKDQDGKTVVHVFTGEGVPFGKDEGSRLADITDGTSNTILAVEAGPSTAAVWTQPGGLAFDAENPAAALGDVGESFNAVFIDGFARRLPSKIDAETLKRLIQHADGNAVEIP